MGGTVEAIARWHCRWQRPQPSHQGACPAGNQMLELLLSCYLDCCFSVIVPDTSPKQHLHVTVSSCPRMALVPSPVSRGPAASQQLRLIPHCGTVGQQPQLPLSAPKPPPPQLSPASANSNCTAASELGRLQVTELTPEGQPTWTEPREGLMG